MRYFSILMLCFFVSVVSAYAAPPPSQAFGTLPAVYDASISPDGTKIAMIENNNNSGEYIVNVIDRANENAVISGPVLIRGINPNWIKWVNNERIHVGVVQNVIRGDVPVQFTYIINVGLDGMTSDILVNSMKNRRQFNSNVIDFLDDDPKYILMSIRPKAKSGRGIGRNPELRKVNVENGNFIIVEKSRDDVRSWTVDRRRQPRVGEGVTKKTRDKDTLERTMIIRDTNGETWRGVDFYPGLTVQTNVFGFTGNPDELIVGQYKNLDTLGLYIYNLASKSFTRKLYHNEDFDVSGLIYSATGDEVIGVQYVDDKPVRVLFDAADTNIQLLTGKYPGTNARFVEASKTGDYLYRISGPSSPDFMVLLNGQTRAVDWKKEIYPELAKAKMGGVKNVTYKSRDGFDIPGFITMPPNMPDAMGKRIPFIVLPHGGPHSRDSKRFDYFAQFFATRGYGVLQMNFRGSTGYGKSFADAGRKNWIVMQDDVEDGTHWLIEQGYAEPSRICIAGWSYGGYAALMGAIKNPDLYKCAISMAGVTDLNDMVRDIRQYEFGRSAAKTGILAGFDGKEDLKINSPVKRAAEIQAPVFLAHGRIDQRVHFDQFKRMEKALKKSKAQVIALPLNGENHFLSDQYNRDIFFVNLDQFLLANLGRSQYAP